MSGYEDQLHILQNVHKDFNGTGVTPMDTSNNLLSGRPYGGVGVMWRKNLDHMCKVIKFDDPRLIGLEISCDDNIKINIIGVYLPYEKYDNHDE